MRKSDIIIDKQIAAASAAYKSYINNSSPMHVRLTCSTAYASPSHQSSNITLMNSIVKWPCETNVKYVCT